VWEQAYSLALAAKMAYENSDIIKCEVKKWGFTQCRVVRYQNSKAYIASNDEMVLLVRAPVLHSTFKSTPVKHSRFLFLFLFPSFSFFFLFLCSRSLAGTTRCFVGRTRST
jgi:hypothetical protein